MDHLDEHRLTMYVLAGEKLPAGERVQVEEHLALCHGCSAMAEEIRAFYAAAEEELTRIRNDADGTSPVLPVPAPRGRPVGRVVWAPPGLLDRPPTPLDRFRLAVRRHPAASGITGFALVAALAGFLTLLPDPDAQERPDYYRLSEDSESLEVFGENDQELWRWSVTGFRSYLESERLNLRHTTGVLDLNGDGSKEVLTYLPFERFGDRLPRTLRAIEAGKKILWTREFGDTLTYAGRYYPAQYTLANLIVRPEPGEGLGPEILVCATDERSPCCIVRLDGNGRTLGEYWHFGYLHSLYRLNAAPGAGDRLIASGLNDVLDATGGSFPVIAVLDPSKITGTKASPHTPGFSFPPSDAEEYYIRLPFPDFDWPLSVRASIQRVKATQDSLLDFVVYGGNPDAGVNISFTFDRSFVAQLVWVDDTSRDFLVRHLQSRGLEPDVEKYILQPLKEEIRYWDGSAWRKEPVRISPTGGVR